MSRPVRPRPSRRRRSRSEAALDSIAPIAFVLSVAIFVLAVFVTFGLPRLGAGLAPATPSASPVPTPLPTASSEAVAPITTPAPLPSATPIARRPVGFDLVSAPSTVFASEVSNRMCAAAAVQITINVASGQPDTSTGFQKSLQARIGDWTTKADSHDGGWGPDAMVAALADAGFSYTTKVFASRDQALRASAAAIEQSGQPAVLLAWRGAHAWVMTGFRATADPVAFADAHIDAATIFDPWYPRISSIWGRSAPPGALHDAADLARNFLAWQRPEGHYPGRDGKFVVVLPAADAQMTTAP